MCSPLFYFPVSNRGTPVAPCWIPIRGIERPDISFGSSIWAKKPQELVIPSLFDYVPHYPNSVSLPRSPYLGCAPSLPLGTTKLVNHPHHRRLGPLLTPLG